jgi:hypothetical protein
MDTIWLARSVSSGTGGSQNAGFQKGLVHTPFAGPLRTMLLASEPANTELRQGAVEVQNAVHVRGALSLNRYS